MDNTEIEKLVWSCIEPAPKSAVPQTSDGYDKADVFMAVNRTVQKCIDMWAKKADKWNDLETEVEELKK